MQQAGRPGPGAAATPERSAPTPGAGTSRGGAQGVYVISVAARLLDMHPQTLRKYERMGLVAPSRTVGMLRLYSDGDLAKLRLIRYLTEEVGVNLAGVQLVLELLEHLARMRRRLWSSGTVEELRVAVERELRGILDALDLPEDLG